MLAHCVQDATVVDVEKRRNPSKHYVSAARGGGRLLGEGVEECWPETPPFTPGATPRGSPLSAQLSVPRLCCLSCLRSPTSPRSFLGTAIGKWWCPCLLPPVKSSVRQSFDGCWGGEDRRARVRAARGCSLGGRSIFSVPPGPGGTVGSCPPRFCNPAPPDLSFDFPLKVIVRSIGAFSFFPFIPALDVTLPSRGSFPLPLR